HEKMVAAWGEARVRERLDEESRLILDEYLAHGRAVRAERRRAEAAGETPDFLPLLRAWGGVTIAYRHSMTESPAYIRNHEEINKALEEGIYYLEALDPKEVKRDRFGHVEAMVFRRQARGPDGRWHPSGEEVVLPARSILVATGALPNVAYEFEHKGHFAKESGHYQTYESRAGVHAPVRVADHLKVESFGPFTSYDHAGRRVSFLGDTHPVFHGSVVGAIASALRTYPRIVELFGERARARGDEREYAEFRERMQALFQAELLKVRRLAPDVVELRIRAPLRAQKFRPGQFYRIQNYESFAPVVEGTRLHAEALALSGARVDKDFGEIQLIAVEKGASSRLCATFQPGTPVALMGPTGVRT